MISSIISSRKYKIPSANKLLTIGVLKDKYGNKQQVSVNDKKNTRILFIDDEGYDDEPLKKLGYLDIDKKLSFTKISDYENYDVIFCDINNIAPSFTNQGAELAKQIKDTFPEKCVVIFTGNLQNIGMINKYKENVDFMVEKNADPSDLANIINKHIEKNKNPILYWENIEKEMRNKRISNIEIGIIEHFYVKSILKGENYLTSEMFEYNETHFPTKEIIEFVTMIGNFITAIIGLGVLLG